jgi:glycosyltransferase involved in cell wall biosynthesis
MRMVAEEDTRIRLLHRRWGGYGAACNRALDEARGEYVAFVEGDDFIQPDMLEALYGKGKALDLDVVKSPFFYHHDHAESDQRTDDLADYAEAVSASAPSGAFRAVEHPQMLSMHASIWSGLYRRSFLNEAGIRFAQGDGASAYLDVLFRLRTLLEANRLGWVSKPFYHWRCTNANSTTNQINLAVMTQRWEDAMAYIETRPADESARVLPYLIVDYYNSTLRRVLDHGVGDALYARMRGLLRAMSVKGGAAEGWIEADQRLLLRLFEDSLNQTEFLARAKRRLPILPESPQAYVNALVSDPFWRGTQRLRMMLDVKREKRGTAEIKASNWREAMAHSLAITRSPGWRIWEPVRLFRSLLPKMSNRSM